MSQRDCKKRGFYTSLLLRDTEDIAARRRRILTTSESHQVSQLVIVAVSRIIVHYSYKSKTSCHLCA